MIPNNPLVSIVMPAYNSERFIKQAMESVVSQTYQNWELIIVDDGSKDATVEIVKGFKDSRIIIAHNDTNRGVAYSRNRGAEIAEANWIAFLDSDDAWMPEKLESQIKHIGDNPEGKLFFTGSAFITSDGRKLDYCLHVPDKITRNEILKQNLISCSSVIVKRELFLENRMPEIRKIHEDFASWLSILNEEKYAYGLDKPLLIYRLQSDSKSGNKLKAAVMQWRTYQVAGEGFLSSCKNIVMYMINGIEKYKNLRYS